jgi:hypothetical protein
MCIGILPGVVLRKNKKLPLLRKLVEQCIALPYYLKPLPQGDISFAKHPTDSNY